MQNLIRPARFGRICVKDQEFLPNWQVYLKLGNMKKAVRIQPGNILRKALPSYPGDTYKYLREEVFKMWCNFP
jgi:hypothetical protein